MKIICMFLAMATLPLGAEEFYAAKYGDQPDHLTPIRPGDDYESRIADHLFSTSGRFGRFVVRPSFSAESCVSVHAEISEAAKKKHGGWYAVPDDEKKYIVTVTQASESLWYSMAENNDQRQTKEVEVRQIDREISLELAIAIQRAWGRMLQHTRYPAKVFLGADGVTYRFSVWVRGLGCIHGETWSPSGGLLAEMASLGEALAEFVSDQGSEEMPLISRLKAFEAKVPELD